MRSVHISAGSLHKGEWESVIHLLGADFAHDIHYLKAQGKFLLVDAQNLDVAVECAV